MIPASSWVSRFTDMKTDKSPVPFDKLADFNSATELVKAIQEDVIRDFSSHRGSPKSFD